MAQTLLYRLLESPFVYSLSQQLLALGSEFLLRKQYKNIFNESRGLVLDVGCGPKLTTPVTKGIIVGIDINPLYIEKYTGEGVDTDIHFIKEYKGPRNRFGFVCSADNLLFNDNIFDEARSFGLLHHLPTGIAIKAIKEMIRCTRPFCKIIIFDNIWPNNYITRPLAWLARRYDRGQWVRTEKELFKLVNIAYQGNWHMKRFTYTFTGLEGILLTIEKS